MIDYSHGGKGDERKREAVDDFRLSPKRRALDEQGRPGKETPCLEQLDGTL